MAPASPLILPPPLLLSLSLWQRERIVFLSQSHHILRCVCVSSQDVRWIYNGIHPIYTSDSIRIVQRSDLHCLYKLIFNNVTSADLGIYRCTFEGAGVTDYAERALVSACKSCRHADRHADRQTCRQTDMQTDRHADRQTDRQRWQASTGAV